MCVHAHTHAHADQNYSLSREWQKKDLNLDSWAINPCTELSVETPTIDTLLTSHSTGIPWHPAVIQHRRRVCGNCVVWLQCSWLPHFLGFPWSNSLAPIPQFYLALLQWRQVKPHLWLCHNLLWILSPNIEHSFSANHRNPSMTIIKFPLLVVL